MTEPHPELDDLLASMGQAGARISEIDASEAGAGNISLFLGWDLELRRRFPKGEEIELPLCTTTRSLVAANVESLRTVDVVLWSKHGVMARSDDSATRAVDRIEYAETAARCEYLDLVAGGRADGLTRDELRRTAAFDVDSPWLMSNASPARPDEPRFSSRGC